MKSEECVQSITSVYTKNLVAKFRWKFYFKPNRGIPFYIWFSSVYLFMDFYMLDFGNRRDVDAESLKAGQG